MRNIGTGRFNKGKEAALIFVLLVFISAAAFGVYKVSGMILENVLPGSTSSIPLKGDTGKTSSNVQQIKSSAEPSSSAGYAVTESNASGKYDKIADTKLKSMTLRQKVGQVFIFECPKSDALNDVKNYGLCGYCFSAADFKNKSSADVKKMLQAYQNAGKINMVLCCDEEGGTVVRISCFSALSAEKFKSPQEVYKSGGMSAIEKDTVKKADLLKSLGINMNLAPVCDVSTNLSDFIYARSFGKNAESTAEFVKVSVQAYGNENVSCVLKHFPGYGSNGDTHKGIVYDSRSMESFEKSDFIPFISGINAGAPCVMVSHNIVKSMDAKYPASLSAKVHEVLRQKLAFKGVIMTDDLSMGAVTKYEQGKNACIEAFNAGNDILLTGGSVPENFNAVYNAVKSGQISEERLDESVKRIIMWKYEMGIIK